MDPLVLKFNALNYSSTVNPMETLEMTFLYLLFQTIPDSQSKETLRCANLVVKVCHKDMVTILVGSSSYSQ